MDGLAEDEFCWFRPPKSVQEEDSLLVKFKLKSTRYKDKWVVEVLRTSQAAREPIVFKVDRLQIIVVAKNIPVLQLFISRMPNMCEIPQLVSAPLNPIFNILDPGSMFKEYDLQRVQSLDEKLEDLDNLSLNYWLTKFVQEVANKNGRQF